MNHPFHYARVAGSPRGYLESSFGTFDALSEGVDCDLGSDYARLSAVRIRERDTEGSGGSSSYGPYSEDTSSSIGCEDEGFLKEFWRLICCFGNEDRAQSRTSR